MDLKTTTQLAFAAVLAATMAHAHGDVSPQPVDTDVLPEVGEEWLDRKSVV